MLKEIMVKKRDGTKEVFDPNKIHKILFWATEDITGVAVSQIETKAQLQLYPGISTDDIHEIMIAAAHELITENTPNYQWVAARLRLFQLRKEALGQFEPWPLYDLVSRNVQLGYYTEELMSWYTKEEFDEMDNFIDHSKDFTHAFAGMEQFHGKYLVQNRVTKQVYETPQYLNLLVAASLFHKYPDETRLSYVKELYNYLSSGVISFPTPIMAGMRTPEKQFSSCVLIEANDTLKSINATSSAIVEYISQKAGIGLEGGHIRAVNTEVAGGRKRHTGVTPFYRLFQSAVKSCSQGGVRGGAATLYAPYWHYEIETIMSLRSTKISEEKAVRQLDYGIQFNGLAYERLLQGGNITLFSPHEVPDLHKAFFDDQEKFKELYEKYERSTSITKKTVPAIELFSKYETERKETGRIYKMHVDHVNSHSAFDAIRAPIKMSNLCVEITLPTQAMNGDPQEGIETITVDVPLEQAKKFSDRIDASGNLLFSSNTVPYTVVENTFIENDEAKRFTVSKVKDDASEIALCTLAGANMGTFKTKEDMERPLELVVRALNEVLDYQEYPVTAGKISTMKYRPLGVGITNLAYWLAKHGYKYSDDSGVEAWDEMMEAFQYYLIKASMTLAKEKGYTFPGYQNTTYSKGIMPIDTYKKDIDTDITPHKERMDWQWLRDQVAQYGMYNATLSAGMPAETSAQIANATNGFEAPRAFVSVKGSGEGRLKQVVPGFPRLKNKYELLWDQESPRGYMNLCAIAQKYFDQSISTNTFYNPEHYENEEVPMSVLLQDSIYSYRIGLKTLYYSNTFDGQTDDQDTDECSNCKL